MIVDNKGKFFSTRHIWFDDLYNNIKNISSGGADEVFLHANQVPLECGRWGWYQKQYSLITDLQNDECDLWSSVNKTFKYDINKSKRDGIDIRTYSSLEILDNADILNDFAEVYTNMYTEKGMTGKKLGISELRAYAKSGHLVITAAIFDDKVIVYHSYVFNEECCRLLHSCSEFRAADKNIRNLIGRANKRLHWEDIIMFKAKGVKYYDWGGVASFDNPNGIDNFKMSFGNERVSYYNVHIFRSLKRKIYHYLFGK